MWKCQYCGVVFFVVLSYAIWSQLSVFGTFLFELSTLIHIVERGSIVVGKEAAVLGNDGLSSFRFES